MCKCSLNINNLYLSVMKASAFPPAICYYRGYVLSRESKCVYVCELKLKQA